MNAERPTILALAGVPDALLARIAERYEVIDESALECSRSFRAIGIPGS